MKVAVWEHTAIGARLLSMEQIGRSLVNLTGLNKLVLDVSRCPALTQDWRRKHCAAHPLPRPAWDTDYL
eukprot:5651873-Amphidinium_carterae.1